MNQNESKLRKDRVLIIGGRPNVGKTEVIINYVNSFPNNTILLSFENTKETLYQRGLNKNVVVDDSCILDFSLVDNEVFDSICIDNLETLNIKECKKFIRKLLDKGKRVVITTHLQRDTFKIHNIFEEI